MSGGQILKKRPAGDGNDGAASEYGSLEDQLPSLSEAEKAIAEARDAAKTAERTAARQELERKIREKRDNERRERENVCRCW